MIETYRPLVTRRLFVAGALLLALPFTARTLVHAQDAAATSSYTWTFQYKKGEVRRYRENVHITGQVPNGGGDLSLVVKGVNQQKVQDVTDTGDAIVVETIEAQEITANGQPVPDNVAQHPIVTQTMSKTGLILKHSVENAQLGSEKLEQVGIMLSTTPVPAQAVKIGDSWKNELDNRLVEGKKVTLTSTLVGTEKVAGVDTLKVKVQMAIPTAPDADADKTLKAEGNYNVDAKTGRLMHGSYTVENVQLDTPLGAIKAKMVGDLVLIVPGVNDKEEPSKDKTQSIAK